MFEPETDFEEELIVQGRQQLVHQNGEWCRNLISTMLSPSQDECNMQKSLFRFNLLEFSCACAAGPLFASEGKNMSILETAQNKYCHVLHIQFSCTCC